MNSAPILSIAILIAIILLAVVFVSRAYEKHEDQSDQGAPSWEEKRNDKETALRAMFIGLLLMFTLGLVVFLVVSRSVSVNESVMVISDGEVPSECQVDTDCHTPFEYMVRSDCPFESICADGECQVVCPDIAEEDDGLTID